MGGLHKPKFAHLKPLAQVKLPLIYVSDLRFDNSFTYQLNTSAYV